MDALSSVRCYGLGMPPSYLKSLSAGIMLSALPKGGVLDHPQTANQIFKDQTRKMKFYMLDDGYTDYIVPSAMRPIAQTKQASSRAVATFATIERLPL